MEYCPNCGYPVSSQQNFCQNCGYPLTARARQMVMGVAQLQLLQPIQKDGQPVQQAGDEPSSSAREQGQRIPTNGTLGLGAEPANNNFQAQQPMFNNQPVQPEWQDNGAAEQGTDFTGADAAVPPLASGPADGNAADNYDNYAANPTWEQPADAFASPTEVIPNEQDNAGQPAANSYAAPDNLSAAPSFGASQYNTDYGNAYAAPNNWDNSGSAQPQAPNQNYQEAYQQPAQPGPDAGQNIYGGPQQPAAQYASGEAAADNVGTPVADAATDDQAGANAAPSNYDPINQDYGQTADDQQETDDTDTDQAEDTQPVKAHIGVTDILGTIFSVIVLIGSYVPGYFSNTASVIDFSKGTALLDKLQLSGSLVMQILMLIVASIGPLVFIIFSFWKRPSSPLIRFIAGVISVIGYAALFALMFYQGAITTVQIVSTGFALIGYISLAALLGEFIIGLVDLMRS